MHLRQQRRCPQDACEDGFVFEVFEASVLFNKNRMDGDRYRSVECSGSAPATTGVRMPDPGFEYVHAQLSCARHLASLRRFTYIVERCWALLEYNIAEWVSEEPTRTWSVVTRAWHSEHLVVAEALNSGRLRV